jgi:hypothetical protein
VSIFFRLSRPSMPLYAPSAVSAARGMAARMPPMGLQDTGLKAINPKFRSALMAGWYLSIDYGRKGFLTWEDFSFYFTHCSSEQEREYVFRLLDPTGSGRVVYQVFQDFVAPPGVPTRTGKIGSSAFLTYPSLLQAVRWTCEREPLTKQLQQANEPFPPSVDWLMRCFQAEWEDPSIKPYLDYVLSAVPVAKEGRAFLDGLGGLAVRDSGNEGMTLDDFCHRLPALQAGLTVPEVAALRLFTGPAFSVINRSLRAKSDHFLVTRYLVDSAIGKLAQLSGPQLLYRGMLGAMPKKWERHSKANGGLGSNLTVVMEPAIISATTDPLVALQSFGGPTMFVLHTGRQDDRTRAAGFLDTGADVRWISQCPSEMEVLFPSLAIFVSHPRCPHYVPLDIPLTSPFLPSKSNSKIFEFAVYYPWDFERQCPLVKKDFLGEANSLLAALVAQQTDVTDDCHAGHVAALAETFRRGSAPQGVVSASPEALPDYNIKADPSVQKGVMYGEIAGFVHPSLQSTPVGTTPRCVTPTEAPGHRHE